MVLYGYLCRECDTYWAAQAAPGQDHIAVTTWCPLCLPMFLPELPQEHVEALP